MMSLVSGCFGGRVHCPLQRLFGFGGDRDNFEVFLDKHQKSRKRLRISVNSLLISFFSANVLLVCLSFSIFFHQYSVKCDEGVWLSLFWAPWLSTQLSDCLQVSEGLQFVIEIFGAPRSAPSKRQWHVESQTMNTSIGLKR